MQRTEWTLACNRIVTRSRAVPKVEPRFRRTKFVPRVMENVHVADQIEKFCIFLVFAVDRSEGNPGTILQNDVGLWLFKQIELAFSIIFERAGVGGNLKRLGFRIDAHDPGVEHLWP